MNSDTFRLQLAESADHIGAAVACAALTCDPLELETLAIRLHGMAQHVKGLRYAILTARAGTGARRDDCPAQGAT